MKVHPAIYYADLAAERARCYLHRVYQPWPVENDDEDGDDEKDNIKPAAKQEQQKGQVSTQATRAQGGKDHPVALPLQMSEKAKGKQRELLEQSEQGKSPAEGKDKGMKEKKKKNKPQFKKEDWESSTSLHEGLKESMFYI